MTRIGATKVKHYPMFFFATCLFLCNFLNFSIAFDAFGQEIYENKGVFTVANIHVDVSAETASVARKKALEKGEKEAFNILLKRLTMRIDHDRLPVLDSEQVSTYIKDFNVTNEKNSEVRYLADLTYRFKPNDIRLLLRDNKIQFAETISKPSLVLPVYQIAGAVFLWDDPNPWREAWLNEPKIIKTKIRKRMPGLVPMIFGKADLADIATISAELTVKGDMKSLMAITKKYKVAKTLVPFASLRSSAQGIPIIEVRVSEYAQGESMHVFSMKIKAKEMESVASLLRRSANVVMSKIEELWKAENLLKFESLGVVTATFPINSLSEWVDAKRRLEKVAVIENVQLVLFSRRKILLNINFIGQLEQLKLALAQSDLNLTEGEGGWVLRMQKPIRF